MKADKENVMILFILYALVCLFVASFIAYWVALDFVETGVETGIEKEFGIVEKKLGIAVTKIVINQQAIKRLETHSHIKNTKMVVDY